jgi:hypothetical protein
MEGVTGDAALAVSATLNYLAPGSTRNRLYVALGGHLTTTEYAPTTVTIANGRPPTAFEAPYAARANPRASVEIRTIAFFC